MSAKPCSVNGNGQKPFGLNHVAILYKEFLDKIISGEKTVETRFSKNNVKPFLTVFPEDVIYLKYSSGKVVAKADVEKATFIPELTPEKTKKILNSFGREIGLTKNSEAAFLEKQKHKNFCSLIFLKNVQKIEPFEIDKKGYGNMSAWLSLTDIKEIKN